MYAMTMYQYNLMKLFRMKFKTTKHYQSHRTDKKLNELFGQPGVSALQLGNQRVSHWEIIKPKGRMGS